MSEDDKKSLPGTGKKFTLLKWIKDVTDKR